MNMAKKRCTAVWPYPATDDVRRSPDIVSDWTQPVNSHIQGDNEIKTPTDKRT